MSAIANFKKRREAQRAQREERNSEDAKTVAPENEALTLLALLLCCDEDKAIELAREEVERKARFVMYDDKLQGDEKANETMATEQASDDAAAQAVDAADTVSSAADNVNAATADLEGTASQLADKADDISQATEDLKVATEELKKPSAARPSSHGKKAAAPKSSSKK
ncbi:hypothetical protein ABC502_14465 [Alkalimonas sp. NCh-2]|uniref:hypothetical protein n=1 Tax=Alkalimonas sp. NCh-2 TaxID=3144846 RepID=UPI0031F6397F